VPPGPSADSERMVDGRESIRQTEQLVVLALALLFGFIGFAVHFFWLAAIVLMAVLFGLMAARLRSGKGGLVSGVVATVVAEARSVTEGGDPESA